MQEASPTLGIPSLYHIYGVYERLQQHDSLRVALGVVGTRDAPIEDAEKVGCLHVLFLSSLAHGLTGAFLRLEVGNDLRGNDNEGGSGSGDDRGTPAFILAPNAICSIL